MPILHFLADGVRAILRGSRAYWLWVAGLAVLVTVGLCCYAQQLMHGLVVTGLSDQVSWGFYIANFAFLVGIAAAAVLLVIPAYLHDRKDFRSVVLLGEGLAVAAVFGAMTFVLVDLGRPDRIWHVLPVLGRFNFPVSVLAWDIVVLTGYLLLNLGIPMYVLYCHYRGREPNARAYFPWIVLAIFWAISIHTVTAFLFSASSSRPFWNIALLAPRFIATAFVSGPALIILVLKAVRRFARYPFGQGVIDTLALIMGIALQISLFFVGVEIFTDFYNEGAHSASLRYLYFGLHGLGNLRPYIWTALALNVVAVVILTVRRYRRSSALLNLACVLAFTGIWLEKGMGTVIPGFIPTPLGEVFEYTPTAIELGVSLGIWALCALVFTVLAKAGIALERGDFRLADARAAGRPPKQPTG